MELSSAAGVNAGSESGPLGQPYPARCDLGRGGLCLGLIKTRGRKPRAVLLALGWGCAAGAAVRAGAAAGGSDHPDLPHFESGLILDLGRAGNFFPLDCAEELGDRRRMRMAACARMQHIVHMHMHYNW